MNVKHSIQANGGVKWAKFCGEAPSFVTVNSHPPLTKTQKLGLQYEKRVQDYIEGLVGNRNGFSFACNPWVMYHRVGDRSGNVSFCQPDVLITHDIPNEPFASKRIIVCEIKYSHTEESWKQLRLLYEPVLRAIYPEETVFSFVEVCKWFDPHAPYPEKFYYCEDILSAEAGRIGVHNFRPRGRRTLGAAGLRGE